MDWLEIIAWAIVVILAIPLSVLAIECFAAMKRWRPVPLPDLSGRPRCAIVIPAHNEESVIARTLEAVAGQIAPGDRVIVVADNCTDNTANIALAHGAEIAVRNDPIRRGKGYALAFGRDTLMASPPLVAIALDADCTLGEHTLHRLIVEAISQKRPAQASYRMIAPTEAGADRRVAEFAFLVKNWVRPLGLRRLGRPCLLTGTGMAFPWEVFRDAPLGHGHIVEDLGLTVDLALSGCSPVFVPDAEVLGEFPINDKAAESQRRRWEHGHLRVMLAAIPRLLLLGLIRRRLDFAILALDIGVPPLSALVLLVVSASMALGVWVALGGVWLPLAVLGSFGILAAVGLASVWWQYGRRILPAKILLRIPFYAIKKVTLYLEFLVKPQSDWVRTARDQPKSEK